MTTRDDMLKARALIKQGRYKEARRILENVDHPKAKEWLTEIEGATGKSTTYSLSTLLITAGGTGVICLLIGLIVGRMLFNGDGATPAAAVLPTSIPVDTAIPTNTEIPATPTLAVSPTPECWLESWWEEAEPFVVAFLDSTETASQTARMSLSGVIIQVRETQREFEAVDAPECARDIRRELISGMNTAVDGFNSFLGDDEIIAGVQLDLATQYFYTAHELLFNEGLIGDFRLSDTAVFIWGGVSPATLTPAPGT